MYEEFWGEDVPGCPIYGHYAGSHRRVQRTSWHTASPIPPLIVRGWELFDQVAPPDVVEVMRVLLDDRRHSSMRSRSGRRRSSTATCGCTTWVAADKVVLFDWEIAGPGVPAMDFAWYLMISATGLTQRAKR